MLSVALILTDLSTAHAQRWSEHSNFDAIPINLTRRVDGMQLGFWNVARRLDGFQLSYGCTQIADELNGMQLGIGSNWSDSVQGVQLAGLFNVTEELNGVQLGIANITLEESNGLSLGLINFIGRGRIMFETMGTSPGFVDVSFRNGNRFYQYTYTAGVNVAHRAAHFGIGLGGHVEVPWGSIDLDVFGYYVAFGRPEISEETGNERIFSENGAQAELRLSNSFQLGRAFSVVLAASMHAFSGGLDGVYSDYGMSNGLNRAAIMPGFSLGIRLGRDRYPAGRADETETMDLPPEDDAMRWGENDAPVLTPLRIQGSYRRGASALLLVERDGWLVGAYKRDAQPSPREGLLMLRWNDGLLSGAYSERSPDGTAMAGEVELRPVFRDRLLRFEGRSRPNAEVPWDETWRFYRIWDWPDDLQARIDQAAFDFAPSPALEQTPGGAMLSAQAPALFACLYPSSPAKYSDVLITRVESDGAMTKVTGFLRGEYPNGAREETEVTIMIDPNASYSAVRLGMSNIPEPANTSCNVPPTAL